MTHCAPGISLSCCGRYRGPRKPTRCLPGRCQPKNCTPSQHKAFNTRPSTAPGSTAQTKTCRYGIAGQAFGVATSLCGRALRDRCLKTHWWWHRRTQVAGTASKTSGLQHSISLRSAPPQESIRDLAKCPPGSSSTPSQGPFSSSSACSATAATAAAAGSKPRSSCRPIVPTVGVQVVDPAKAQPSRNSPQPSATTPS